MAQGQLVMNGRHCLNISPSTQGGIKGITMADELISSEEGLPKLTGEMSPFDRRRTAPEKGVSPWNESSCGRSVNFNELSMHSICCTVYQGG